MVLKKKKKLKFRPKNKNEMAKVEKTKDINLHLTYHKLTDQSITIQSALHHEHI